MDRMKLFVIDEWKGSKWKPQYLLKGEFRLALNRAQLLSFRKIRVRRVKTPAERDQYEYLNTTGDNIARTEWVN